MIASTLSANISQKEENSNLQINNEQTINELYETMFIYAKKGDKEGFEQSISKYINNIE